MRALPLLLIAGCTTPQSFARQFGAAHCDNLQTCGLLDEDDLESCEEAVDAWLVDLVEVEGCEFDKEQARALLDDADEATCLQSGDWDYVLSLVTLDELVPYTGPAVYTCPAAAIADESFWQAFERLMGTGG